MNNNQEAQTPDNSFQDDSNVLSGPERAAAFILVVGEEKATKIFELMNEEEIKEVSQVMVKMNSLKPETVNAVFMEFANSLHSASTLIGATTDAESFLSKVLSKDKADNIMDDIKGPSGKNMWEKLGNVHEEILANFLKGEYPQTAAVILSKIKSEHSAKVLNLLPPEMATDIIIRMVKLEPVHEEVISDIEKNLRSEFMSNIARTVRRDAFKEMAEIFNHFDHATEQRVFNGIEEIDQTVAEHIRAKMFTFEDIEKVEESGFQVILRVVDREKLVLALKGASDNIKELFFKSMSERAVKFLQEEMTSMGAVRLKDVEDAQTAIVKQVRELAQNGEILIAEKEDEQMIS